jgi:hypothetical protein
MIREVKGTGRRRGTRRSSPRRKTNKMLLRWNPSTHCTHTSQRLLFIMFQDLSNNSFSSEVRGWRLRWQWRALRCAAGQEVQEAIPPMDMAWPVQGQRRLQQRCCGGFRCWVHRGVRRYQSCLRVCVSYVRESSQHSLSGIILDDLNRVKCQFTQGLLLMFHRDLFLLVYQPVLPYGITWRHL